MTVQKYQHYWWEDPDVNGPVSPRQQKRKDQRELRKQISRAMQEMEEDENE